MVDAASLRFLTSDDRRLLVDAGRPLSFAAKEVVVDQSTHRQAIYLVRSGRVSIIKHHLGQEIAVASLGPGEIFGEVGFVDAQGASTTVRAEEETTVDVVEGEFVYSLLSSAPGFSSRFYQSVAAVLARRLRATTSAISALLVEEVPQVKRFHEARASIPTSAAVPPTLVAAVETFKRELLEIDQAIAKNDLTPPEARQRVYDVCTALESELTLHLIRERHREKEIGAYVFRETFPFFMQSRLADRMYAKPRGYAGDFLTIVMMYEDSPAGFGRLGAHIDYWHNDRPAARAVKNRRRMLSEAILDEIHRVGTDTVFRVTSLASGPAKELMDLIDAEAIATERFHATLIDIDEEALAYTGERIAAREMGRAFTLAKENVVRLCRGRGRTTVPPQHCIYSVGLIDYLKDELVVLLLNWIWDHLLPGGLVVLGNFEASNPSKPYMEHVIEWVLIHRTREDLARLFAQSRFGTSPVEIRAEDAGVQLFAFARKPSAG